MLLQRALGLLQWRRFRTSELRGGSEQAGRWGRATIGLDMYRQELICGLDRVSDEIDATGRHTIPGGAATVDGAFESSRLVPVAKVLTSNAD
jgi:hypothetical protein